MATITNDINIAADPQQVWAVVADLEALDRYDPVVPRSSIVGTKRDGSGASRRCDTASGGYFVESVSVWEPPRDLAFTISECSQPMKSLTHTYRLIPDNGGTLISQVMRYTMRFGVVGALMDTVVGRRTADKQIKLFFAGLKRYVETGIGKNAEQPTSVTAAEG